MEKGFWKDLFRKDNKKLKTDIAAIFLIGVLLMVLAGTFFPPGAAKDPSSEIPIQEEQNSTTGGSSTEQLEKRLEKRLVEILKNAEGVGQVEVMITLSTTTEKVLARQTKEENSKGGSGDEKALKEDSVVLADSAKDGSSPVVIMENMPAIEGVVVVAQGGNDIVVKDGIIKAAQALLDVPSHKIQVLKMK